MLSEAVLEDPAIFSRAPSVTRPIMDNEACNSNHEEMTMLDVAFEYLEFATIHPPRHLKIVRGHLFRYLFRYVSSNIPPLLIWRWALYAYFFNWCFCSIFTSIVDILTSIRILEIKWRKQSR